MRASEKSAILSSFNRPWRRHPGVSSVRVALDAVSADRPDVIVSNLAMPGEDGHMSLFRAPVACWPTIPPA